jgi:hypothetical protein
VHHCTFFCALYPYEFIKSFLKKEFSSNNCIDNFVNYKFLKGFLVPFEDFTAGYEKNINMA